MSRRHYRARCHCGLVRFSFWSEEITKGRRCNCSICVRKGAVVSVQYVPAEDFEPPEDATILADYRWSDGVVNHLFCRRCGIYPYHGDAEHGYRVNLGCVEDLDVFALEIDVIDGRSFPVGPMPPTAYAGLAHGRPEKLGEIAAPSPVSSSVRGMFVPGLCCRSDIWEQAGALLPGVDVVTLDWPWPERIASYDDGAAWLADEIRAHRPRFVVAHSFAGVLALHHCSRLPAPPEWSLVIVDTFLVTPHPFFRNHVWQPTPALRERIATMLSAERSRFPILREVASSEDPPGWRDRALEARATYVYGGRSGEHAPAALGELAGVPASAGHDVRVVPATSHFLMLERPEAFYATLRDVLKI